MVDFGTLERTLDNIFAPPTDVMVDPSLLVAMTSLDQLPESTLLSSQTQATLTRIPSETRVGDVHVPATFQHLVAGGGNQDVTTTGAWNYYRGQAESASPNAVRDLLTQNDITAYDASDGDNFRHLDWASTSASDHGDQLTQTLTEVLAFLADGGILLSRRPMSINACRDAGVPEINLGSASLSASVAETLDNVGYDTPVSMCSFAVSDVPAVGDALVGGLTEGRPEMLLYTHSR